MTCKILHLITGLEGGGTENFLFQILASSPSGYNHQVVYLKKDGVMGNRIRTLGVPVQKASSAASVYQLLRAQRPDVLHTCLYRAHQVGRVIGHAAKVPFIISSQRSIDAWQMPWHAWLDAWTLRWCHVVLVNSHAAASLVEKRRGKRPAPAIIKIDNGIDPRAFIPVNRVEARQAYALPSDAIVGGTMMRLHPEKGADWIPQFAGLFLSSRPNVHLLVAGVGPLDAHLRRQTASQGWSKRLHWIGWEDRSARFLSALDFFWSLSREESFPQTLIEAAGIGLPCIAPEVGDIRELLTTDITGIPYAPTGAIQAARAADDMVEHLSLYRDKAAGRAALVRERFALEKMVQSFYRHIDTARSHPL